MIKAYFITLICTQIIFAQNLFLSAEPFDRAYFQTVEQRFAPPAGFKRIAVRKNGFTAWLRKLPLLPQGQRCATGATVFSKRQAIRP